jgi:PAS domain S-box-containing protein
MFHFRREEVVGRKVGFIVPEDLIASDELGWIQREIEREGVLSNFITRRIPKDGPEITVSLTRTVLHDDQGRVVGSTAIIRDVTAHMEAEQELARTSHLATLGELAATVAHEIKNPLTGIYTAIQILSRALEPDDPRKSVFDDIQGEIRRLDNTVQDLLGFARPSVPKPMPTDLATFIKESLEAPGVQAELARHRLELELPEACIVPIEASLILPAVNNIVVNAAQAMESAGTVRVSATEKDGFVTIAVSDSGPGIPADGLERIFEPFNTSKARGTGLGLSIARKNVEAHGGSVVAENPPGGGARFSISLPLK